MRRLKLYEFLARMGQDSLDPIVTELSVTLYQKLIEAAADDVDELLNCEVTVERNAVTTYCDDKAIRRDIYWTVEGISLPAAVVHLWTKELHQKGCSINIHPNGFTIHCVVWEDIIQAES